MPHFLQGWSPRPKTRPSCFLRVALNNLRNRLTEDLRRAQVIKALDQGMPADMTAVNEPTWGWCPREAKRIACVILSLADQHDETRTPWSVAFNVMGELAGVRLASGKPGIEEVELADEYSWRVHSDSPLVRQPANTEYIVGPDHDDFKRYISIDSLADLASIEKSCKEVQMSISVRGDE